MKQNKGSTMFSNIETSPNGRVMTFDITGFDTSMVNALRRTILNDIVNVGFGYEPENTIKVLKNTTGLDDEFISHRLSLVPVMISDWMEGKIDINDYKFMLKVSQKSQASKKGIVTTDDFVLVKKTGDREVEMNSRECFPRDSNYDTPILISRFPNRDSSDQELEVECKLTTGTQGNHASFSPTVLCVAWEDEKVHKFKLESMGIWHPYTLVKTGLENLLARCLNVKKSIEKDNIGKKYKGKYAAIDYSLHEQSHTLGNMLQEWIYNHEFKGDEERSISHVSYHEPHPLENTIIFRISLNTEDNLEFDDYIEKTDELMVKYLSSLYTHLENTLNTWMSVSKPRGKTLLKN